MIVLEGPDGSGKTSLAKRLTEDLHLPVMPKAVNPDMQATQSITEYVDHHLKQGWSPRVYDRFALISGPIYDATFRKKPPWHDDAPEWLPRVMSRFYDEIRPLVIVCLPPFETVWENCQRDESNARLFPNKPVLTSVWYQYHSYWASRSNTLRYNYTKNSIHSLTSFVRGYIYQRENR